MQSFAEQIRALRKKRGDPLRVVAAYLNIDQAILSKLEHGKRKASKEQVLKMAEYFGVKKNVLLVSWLSDNIAYELKDEDLALKALEVAEEKVAYRTFAKTNRKNTIHQLVKIIKRFPKVRTAWIYGSFSRQDDVPGSDIDIAVETEKGFTYFDLAEIQYHLENEVKRKIDIGFMDSFKPYIFENLKQDLQVIYERP